MQGLTVKPLTPGTAELSEVPGPDPAEGSIVVEAVAGGVDGTDHENIDGAYCWAPRGGDRLVLGHESLGRVLESPADSGFGPGDLVVGIVRHPDPVPCGPCASG